MEPGIAVDRGALAAFCRRNDIARLSFYGSVLRADFGPESDVDVLVEFGAGARVTLLDIVRMEEELTECLGRKADLRTPAELSRHFRDEVLAVAVVQYEAA
jgi:predicted nucleotidyltransferase